MRKCAGFRKIKKNPDADMLSHASFYPFLLLTFFHDMTVFWSQVMLVHIGGLRAQQHGIKSISYFNQLEPSSFPYKSQMLGLKRFLSDG
jgi:hypothetical protein